MLNLKVTSAFVVVAAISSPAIADLRITEVMSSSNGGGSPTGDFFEVTNYGSSAVSLSGWKMDDNSFALANAVAMSGIASIGAGESVIFLESAAGAAINSFRTFWGCPESRLVTTVVRVLALVLVVTRSSSLTLLEPKQPVCRLVRLPRVARSSGDTTVQLVLWILPTAVWSVLLEQSELK